VSFHDLWSARKVAPDDSEPAAEPLPVAGPVPTAELPRATIEAGGSGSAKKDKKLASESRSTDDPVHAPDRS
jgi:hypothetical protein